MPTIIQNYELQTKVQNYELLVYFYEFHYAIFFVEQGEKINRCMVVIKMIRLAATQTVVKYQPILSHDRKCDTSNQKPNFHLRQYSITNKNK